jgi:hypothetical protein
MAGASVSGLAHDVRLYRLPFHVVSEVSRPVARAAGTIK